MPNDRAQRRGLPRPLERLVRRAARLSSHFLNDTWVSPDGLPANNPSTLMSSSISSQWMPWPFPISRQLSRSSGVTWTSRGNQTNGTEMVRPSLRSTLKVSSVTVTFSAVGTAISTAEILIPRLQECSVMIVYKLVHSTNLSAGKSSTPVQSDRLKPELGQFLFTFDMHMRRFIAIPCIEEKTVRPDSQSCWHYSTFILPVLA